ncbi:MAG: hypothetical protein NZ866_02995 [Patescibacteria group bacterium]|nr:hypothetical protein [Patescibacteria group bacterium]
MADWKTIDRASTEIGLTYEGKAQGMVIMASAPLETINRAIKISKKI